MGDFNDDIRGNVVKQFFAQFQMKEAITSLHGKNAPNTFRGGSAPIDGIFVSPTINISRAGYTEFTWGLSTDYRCLWIELDMQSIFGTTHPVVGKMTPRRLKNYDP